jgi:rubrerythrin
MVRPEERRLKSLFRKLLLTSLALPAAGQACSKSTSAPDDAGVETNPSDASTSHPDAGGADGGSPLDGAAQSDATEPSDGTATSSDAGDAVAACTVGWPYEDEAGLVIPDSSTDASPRQCYYFRDYTCGPTLNYAPSPNCYLTLSDCAQICPSDAGGDFDCLFREGHGCTDGGTTWEAGQPASIECGVCSGVGRRPSGLEEPRAVAGTSALGAYFARAAHLEAASVRAFRVLGDELRAAGAPRSLVRMAARAARDEVRHARATRRIARRFGGTPPRVRARRSGARPLAAIALENVVEGCVRETFGALVATWQAANAEDRAIRRSMERIAADETRHAALAWAVARWIEPQLDDAGRADVARARSEAVRALLRDVAAESPRALETVAGLPRSDVAAALVRELGASLWSPDEGSRVRPARGAKTGRAPGSP